LKARGVLAGLKAEGEDEKVGLEILRLALEQPLRALAKNSGADDGYVLKKVEEGLAQAKNGDFGFNVLTLEFGSMIAQGIIDPLKVTRMALQNAASVGAMVLTTEVLICDLPEKKEATPPVPGAGMGGMGEEY